MIQNAKKRKRCARLNAHQTNKYENYSYVKDELTFLACVLCNFGDCICYEMIIEVVQEKELVTSSDSKKSPGFIYCLSNVAFGHNVFKIGFTQRTPFTRMDELYSTGVPFPFTLEFAKEIELSYETEQIIHRYLCNFRMNKHREFFRVSIDIIKAIFDNIDGEYFVFTYDEYFNKHTFEPFFIEDNEGWLEKTKPMTII